MFKKVDDYGIVNIILNGFRSYLSNRPQCVKRAEATSSWLKVECGVPQGSTLDSILFLIFIEHLPQSCRNTDIYLFADDTNKTRIG